MKGSGIPDGWGTTSQIGKPVSGTSFLAFKVPLSDALCRNIPPSERFTPKILLEKEPNLRLIIDLTNTKRYYDPNEFIERGLRYEKILCPGRQIPKKHLMNRFFYLVDEFMESRYTEGKLIGVHCTHGINRTGYFICTYMIRRLGFTPDEAISKFQEARGQDIVRDYFITELKQEYSQNSYQKNNRNRLHASQSSIPQRIQLKIGNRPPQGPPGFSNPRKNPFKLDNRQKKGPFNKSTPYPLVNSVPGKAKNILSVVNLPSKTVSSAKHAQGDPSDNSTASIPHDPASGNKKNLLENHPSIVPSSKKSKKKKSISINPFSTDPSLKISSSTKQSQEDPSDNSTSSAPLDPISADPPPNNDNSSSEKRKKRKSSSINPFSTDPSKIASTKHSQENPSDNSFSSVPLDPDPANIQSKKPKKKKSNSINPFSTDTSSKIASTKHSQEDPSDNSFSSVSLDPDPANTQSKKPKKKKSNSINPFSTDTSSKIASKKHSQEDPSDNSASSAPLDLVPENTQSKKTLLENPPFTEPSSKKSKNKKSLSKNPFSSDSSSEIISAEKHPDSSVNSISSIPSDPVSENTQSEKTLLENLPSAKKPKKKKSLSKNPFSTDSSSEILSSTKHLQEDYSDNSFPCDPILTNPPSKKTLLENPLFVAPSSEKLKKKKKKSNNHLQENPPNISNTIKGLNRIKTLYSVLEVDS